MKNVIALAIKLYNIKLLYQFIKCAAYKAVCL
jgi:hypothetical protein